MDKNLARVWLSLIFLAVSIKGYSEVSNATPVKPVSPSTRAKFYRRLSSTGSSIDPVLNPPNEMAEKGQEGGEANFNPYFYPYFVGFEGALPLNAGGSLTTSVIQMPAIAFGTWTSPQLGFECYLGYQSSVDSTGTKISTSTQGPAITNKTETTTYAGVTGSGNGVGFAPKFLFGGAVKYRIYQVSHFGVSADFLVAVTPRNSANYYKTGTHTVTTPDISVPGNYTVADSSVVTVNDMTDWLFRGGPRINVEYHFHYFPHLLLGVSLGTYVSVGGEKTTTTTTANKTVAYTGGVAGTPSTDTTQVDVVKTKSTDTKSDTYTIGGTGLNLTGAGGLIPISVVGTFRIRYTF
jgi:hypothetical protein